MPHRPFGSLVLTTILLVFSVGASAQTLTVWPSPLAPRAAEDGSLAYDYVVANTGVEIAHSVVLRDTPAEGAELVSSTPSATAVDADWTWALGDIPPGESVAVSVVLDGGSTVGASVTSTVGALRTAAAPAVVARATDPELDEYLLPSLGADAADPEVLALAASLGGDAARARELVADEIAFEAYRGLLRGARGAWWSRAGNAYDQAGLTIALLRASGVPARFASATLDEEPAAARIASMFAPVTRMSSPRRSPDAVIADLLALDETVPALEDAGLLPVGAEAADVLRDLLFHDPTADSDLLADTADHVWVEHHDGSGWVSFDPTGVAPGASDSVSAAVDAAARHTVEVAMTVETYNPAFGFVSGTAEMEVLRAELASAELEGRPLTISFDSTMTSAGGLVFGSTERRYTPLVQVDGELVATGTTFVELATNFPAATTLIMGAELEITIHSPGQADRVLTHRIADRLGTAARSGYVGDATELEIDTTTALEGLSRMDAVTVNVASGDAPPYAAARYVARFEAARDRLELEMPLLEEIEAASDDGRLRDAADRAAVARVEDVGRAVNEDMGAFLGGHYFDNSGRITDATADDTGVLAYSADPRVVVVGVRSSDAGPAPRVDLAAHEVRVVVPAGVPSTAALEFRTSRGLAESELEAWVLSTMVDEGEIISFGTVATAAAEQGIMMREIYSGNVDDVDRLDISQDARAGIRLAVDAGRQVLVPERTPELAGGEYLVWLERDPATGHTESVDANGHHMAAVQYATISNSILGEGYGLFLGGLVGFSSGTLAGLAKVLSGELQKFSWASFGFELAKCLVGKDASRGARLSLASGDIGGLMMALAELAIPKGLGVAEFIGGFSFGACLGALAGSARVAYLAGAAIDADPPLPAYDVGLIGPLRRPLSADFTEVAVSAAGAGTPTIGEAPAWHVSGPLAVAATGVRGWGSIRLSGSAEVRDAEGAVVSTGEFTAEATDLWIAGAVALTYDGTLGVSGERPVGAAFAFDGTTSSDVVLYGTIDGGDEGTFALSSADVTLTGGPLTFDVDSVDASLADGSLHAGAESWSSVSGSIGIAAGPAHTVTESLSGSGDYVMLSSVPADATTGVGGAITIPFALSGTIDAATVHAEGPIGWDVAIEDGAVRVEVPAVDVADGPWPVYVWATTSDGALSAGATTTVAITAGEQGVEIVVDYAPIYTTFIDGMLAPSVVSVDVRNSGPEVVTAALALDVTEGFSAVAGLESFVLRPGESGGTLVAVAPTGAVPAPGGAITVTGTLTAGAAEASDSAEYAFPEVTRAEVVFDPAFVRAEPGTTIETELVVEARGNTTRTADVLRDPSQYLQVDGVPDDLVLEPGVTTRIPVTVTLSADAPFGFVHGTLVDVMVGEVMQGRAPLSLQATSAGAAKIQDTADLAESLGEVDLADGLRGLAETFELLETGCSTELVRDLEIRLRTVSNAMEGDDLALLAGDLWDEADELAATGYACDRVDLVWLCDVVLQLADVLGAIDEELGAPVLVTDILGPGSVRNGDAVTFEVTVENTGGEESLPATLAVSVRQAAAAVELAQITVDPLAASATRTYEVEWDTSEVLGTFAVIAAGPRNTLYETVEVLPAVEPPEGNSPPVFEDAPPTSLAPGEDIAYSPTVTDPDDDPIFLAAPVLPVGLRFVDGALVGSISREGTWSGVMVAQDRYGATATLDFEIEVALLVDNAPPVVTSRPPRAVVADETLNYSPTAVDPDADPVSWTLTEGPVGADLTDGTLTWTPSIEDVGRHWFVLTASDGRDGTTAHAFSVDVRESSLGPDLVIVSVDVSGADLSGEVRTGSAFVTVANVGDSDAGAADLQLYEDHDGIEGFAGADVAIGSASVPALAAGASAAIEATLSGTQAFPGSLVRAHVDVDDVVVEEDETNNVGSHVPIDVGPYYYAGYRPTDTEVVLLAPSADAAFRVIDPATGDIVHEGTLEAKMPTWVAVTLPDTEVVLDHFVVESDEPVQVYIFHEIFDPNFGGDLFHPAMTGDAVGRDFVLFVPTLTSNNALIVMAIEAADIVLEDIDGETLEEVDLAAGQWWEPTTLSAGTPAVLHSTGDLVVQSVSVTGASAVPPADVGLAEQGDVGTEFRFSTRSRGSGGGAVAVFAYEDASYDVVTNDGFTLVSGTLEAGGFAFHPGLGERRGAQVVATGMVAVMAGDIARAGAETIGLMGEDITQWVGDGGRDIVVHSQQQTVGRSVVLAGPAGASLDVSGATVPLGPFGIYELEDDTLVHVRSSTPVVVQAMGGGDRYFDYAAVLRRVGQTRARPLPVLTNVAIDTTACPIGASATARIGNGGGAPIPVGSALELVVVSPEGESVVGRVAVESPIGPGRWIDVDVVAEDAPANVGSTWLVRFVDAGPGVQTVSSWGAAAPGETVVCRNDPPTFVSTPPTAVIEAGELLYVALAEDPEGEAVHYALVGGPAGTSLRRDSGLLRWRAGTPEVVTFAIQAIDSAGDTALQTFDVTVEPTEPCTDELDTDDDGWCPPEDCADDDPDVNPDAAEITGDGKDNDCDPLTLDTVSGGGLTLAVDTDRETYTPGRTVAIQATVGNESDAVGVSGLVANVTVGCPLATPAIFDAAADVPEIAPSGDVVVGFDWADTAETYGACVARVAVMRDDDVVLTADALFDLESGLVGTLTADAEVLARGDALGLDWEVSNDGEDGVIELVTLRADGWPTLFVNQAATVDAGASTARDVEIATQNLSPAAYRFVLRAGGTELAEASVAVMEVADLPAPWTEPASASDRLLGAPAAPIVWRPNGPLPGGPGMGGRIQAVWTDEALWIRLALADVTEDVDDEAVLRVAADGAEVAEARWTRGDGVDPTSDGDMEIDMNDDETVLTWRLDADDALALDAERELGLHVATTDGPEDALRDAWVWSAGPDDTPADFGVVRLGAPGSGPGEDVGVDAMTDIGGDADAGSDGSGDADVGADAGRRPPAKNGGCGCATRTDARGGLLGVLLVLLAWRLPRRRRPAARRAVGLAAVGLAALWLAACGNSTEFADAGTDVGPDVGAGPEVGPDAADTEVGSDTESDTGTDTFTDAPPIDVNLPPGNQTGEECEEDDDCASGICQHAPDYSVCTQPCDLYPCPDGFSCEDYPGGVRMCVAVAVCIDEDDDSHGVGGGCEGSDCNDSDDTVNSGATEVCNGVDDDCDGDVDEDVLNACGRCGEVPAEVCNGVDDDCDGDVDEDVLNACGECGSVPVEVCNEIDDDCDGSTDEEVCPDCEMGAELGCWGGPEGADGVGICHGGVQRCQAGGWTECIGQVLPEDEVCNGIDDDCDGEIDNGVLNACGECGPDPIEECNGVDDDCDGETDEGVLSLCGGCTPCGSALLFPSESGDPDPALAPAPDGGVTLGTGLLERHDIWVPNSIEGSVSRWDTRTGTELGRYFVGTDPSRTAVDLDGNVWIGHRGDGLATHIYSNIADCVDRNGDGVIQTSRDLNGDGRITGGEVVPEGWDDPLADECVHCQVRVGTSNDLVRGVGVDADNYAWMGTWNSRELYKVDPQTCEIVAQMSTANPETGTNSTPVYGLAIDPDGQLWTSSFTTDCIAHVDTREARVVEQLCYAPTRYGIAVGADGRVWYGGYGTTIVMYDPSTQVWSEIAGPAELRETTGIVAANDGRVFVAGYSSNHVARYDPSTGDWDLFSTSAPPPGFKRQNNPRGVTIDAEGDVWAICRGTSGLIEMTQDGEWLGSYDIVRSQSPTQGTSPYSYSDNTGFQLFNVIANEGQWRNLLDLGATVQLVSLEVDAFVPEGTSVVLEYRAADTLDGLDAAEWSAPTDERLIDLRSVYPGPMRVVEVRATLTTSNPEVRPVLRDVRVLYETADCRLAGFLCPSGQTCDRGTGACTFVPRDCFVDSECAADEYCDGTGLCRDGCRVDESSCEGAETCDPIRRICGIFTAECVADSGCPEGSYCASTGYCTDGCRVDPDTCPARFSCDAETRECLPLPPECALDEDCPATEYCGAGGRCLRGCRAGSDICGEGALCDVESHVCVDAPSECVVADPPDEVCNGADDDCNGTIDDGTGDVGVTCEVGLYLEGTTECHAGRPMCRVDSAPAAPYELVQDAAAALSFSSQAGSGNYSASRATGPANVTGCTASAASWRATSDLDDPEFIELEFPVAVRATGVRIHETYGGPYVTAIDLVTEDGVVLENVWTGTDETVCGEWFEPTWTRTDEYVTSVIIHTSAVGREEIDAVQLVGLARVGSPQLLGGTLTDVILGDGDFVAVADFSVSGNFVVESGASIEDGPAGAWRAQRVSNGDTWITGADIHGATLSWGRVGDTVIEDTVFTGTFGGSDTLTFNGTGRLHLLGVTALDTAVDAQGSMDTLVEFSRFESTDTVGRWLLTTRGVAAVYDSELAGRNLVPRTTEGLRQLGGDLIVESTEIRRTVNGFYAQYSGEYALNGVTIEDSDYGMQLLSGSRGVVTGTSFVGLDIGHTMLPVYMNGLNATASVQITDATMALGTEDRGFVLDPDVFADGSTSGITGTRFTGPGGPEGRYELLGTLDSPSAALALVDHATAYSLAGDVTVNYNNSMSISSIDAYSPNPDVVRTIRVRNGGTLTVTDSTFEDVTIDGNPDSTITMTGGEILHQSTGNRNLFVTQGTGTIVDCRFESTAPVAANQRRNTGAYVHGSGSLSITGSSFYNLNIGVATGNSATLNVSGSYFENYAHGGYLQHTSQVESFDGCTFVDSSADIASIGIHLRFENGGRASVNGASFDIGDEDVSISFEPDCFQDATRTEVSGVTYVDGHSGQGFAIRGDSDGGMITYGSMDGETTYTLIDHVRTARGTQAVIPGTVHFVAPANTGWVFTTQDAGSHAEIQDGATFTDMAIHVGGGSSLDATGSTHEVTSTRGRELIRVWGTATVTDSSFVGFGRRQSGVRVENGGVFTATNSTFLGLDDGVLAVGGSDATVFGGDAEDSHRGVRTYTGAGVSIDGLRIIGGYETVVTGVWTDTVRAGLSLDVANMVFDIGPDDIPFTFETWALADDCTVTLAGSTFVDGEQGQGYRLHGTTNNLAVDLTHLEPAQTQWYLIGDVNVQSVGSLVIPGGTRFAANADGRAVNVRHTTTFNVGAAFFDNVIFRSYDQTTGTVDGATFDFDTTIRRYQLQLHSTEPVTAQNCTFLAVDPTIDIRGIYMSGSVDVTPSVLDNHFENLKWGIYVETGPIPTVSGNTFVNCETDTFGL